MPAFKIAGHQAVESTLQFGRQCSRNLLCEKFSVENMLRSIKLNKFRKGMKMGIPGCPYTFSTAGCWIQIERLQSDLQLLRKSSLKKNPYIAPHLHYKTPKNGMIF